MERIENWWTGVKTTFSHVGFYSHRAFLLKNIFIVELSFMPEVGYHVRVFAMSGRNANVEQKDVNYYPANTRWITSKNAQVLKQHWHARFFTNPL